MAQENDGLNFYLRVQDQFSRALGSFSNKLKEAQEPLGRLKKGLNGLNPQPNTSGMDGMTHSMNNAKSSMDGMHSSMLKSMIEAQALGGVMSGVTGTVTGLFGEVNESTKAWQTFRGNMEMLGKSGEQIDAVKNKLQNYAQATIYSSSDMASAYSQLEATGVKNSDNLVTGFAGLASTSQDSKQAMQSLSEQAIQAASRPTVAWEDFRIMSERVPAGMAQVAKALGTDMKGMTQRIQSGQLSTEDFFNAINKVGNSKAMQKTATQYKTVDEALSGLRESIGNKLQKPFESGSKSAIKAISRVIDRIDGMNFDKYAKPLAKSISSITNGVISGFGYGAKVVGRFMDGFKQSKALETVKGVIAQIQMSMFALQSSGRGSKSPFEFLGKISGNAISGLAKGIGAVTEAISKTNPNNLKLLAGAFLAFKAGTKGLAFGGIVWFLNTLNKQDPALLDMLAKNITKIAWALILFKAVKGLGSAITGISSLVDVMGKLRGGGKKPSTPTVPKPKNVGSWIKFGFGMLMVGGALILAGTGMYILAKASIVLASGGGKAIGVMFGMVVAIGALMAVSAYLGTALTAGAIGLIALGVSIALIGAGIWLATTGLAKLADKLPLIAKFGVPAGASLSTLAGGLVKAGLAGIVGAVGAVAFGLGLFVLGAGLKLVGSGLDSVGNGLTNTAVGLSNLATVVSEIFNSIVSTAQQFISTFISTIVDGVQSAIDGVSSFIGSFTEAGGNLISGLKDGIKNTVGSVIDEVTNVSSKIMDKVKTILGIHSPSKVFAQYGQYLNAGFANGIEKSANLPSDQAENMASDVSDSGDPSNFNPFDNSTNTNNNQDHSSSDNSIVIQSGAIQINGSSGNDSQTGEAIVAQLESYLQNLQNGRLT